MSNHELLRRYIREHSQAAFAAIVARHVDLVYSAALRQVRLSHHAEEVAQSVFVDLARQADGLSADQSLPAWLFVVTRRTAIDVIRREARRRAGEQAAAALAIMRSESSGWTEIAALLDEAVAALDANDRNAILLRYFENQSLREVGRELGISEDTAQKRVSRALERLRNFFAERGVAVPTTAALATQLTSHAVHVAPSELATAIAAAPGISALVGGQVAASGSQAFVVGAAQKLAAGIVVSALVVVSVWEAVAYFRQRAEISAVAVRSVGLDADLMALRRERANAAGRLRTTQEEIDRLAAIPEIELDAEVEAWLARVARLKDLAAQRPEQTLPEFALLREKDWFDAARDAKFDTEEHLREQMRTLRDKARWRTSPLLREALRRFVDAQNGRLPDHPAQLAAVADPSLTLNILGRYQFLSSGNLVDVSPHDWLLEERTSFDETQDNRLYLARWNTGVVPFDAVREPDLRAALQRFFPARGGELPTEPAQLLSYFPRPPSPIALTAWLKKSADDFESEIRKLLPEG